ncbi:ADP-ribosylation factor-like protein 6-interacting protein 4 [Haliotis rubra]|uniref:ADP-ribosylation factor-like protein 6-interacting protein 4 n=1 Tax=Haliotis rubra TaxID=36100 RepID=UPI001EE5719F|nr:ADP-ribosylation factor-like protein 6-interacting protein 4 [Haliotis rubra]
MKPAISREETHKVNTIPAQNFPVEINSEVFAEDLPLIEDHSPAEEISGYGSKHTPDRVSDLNLHKREKHNNQTVRRPRSTRKFSSREFVSSSESEDEEKHTRSSSSSSSSSSSTSSSSGNFKRQRRESEKEEQMEEKKKVEGEEKKKEE